MPNYQTQVDSDLDAAIQRRALKLQAEGKLSIDGRPIELKIGPNGKHVSHYALTNSRFRCLRTEAKTTGEMVVEP